MNSSMHLLPDLPPPQPAAERLLGESAAMQEVLKLIERVAPTDAGVLLTGESGTGKELAAQSIHRRSSRRQGPFVAINCGAVPAGLIEAELFGHEKGSFTGAIRTHIGVFERAHGGTLLLDEITEMPLDMQTRLLRVLEARKFYRVGSGVELSADVRVIAATNRCPLQAVEAGLLREDLLYRLAVFPIALPPLRERGADVERLAEHFLAEANATARTAKRLSGTARHDAHAAFLAGQRARAEELHRARAYSLRRLHRIGAAASKRRRDPRRGVLADRIDIRVGSRIDAMERSLIEATLGHFQGNKRRAADVLGCSLKTLYNKLNEYSQNQEIADR